LATTTAITPKENKLDKAARHVFTLCSPKGGVGKTTIARCLLVAGAQAGLRVIGLDFDPQQSLSKWASRRGTTRLALPSETFVDVQTHAFDLSEWRERLAEFSAPDLLVIDTPPGVEANLPAIRGLCEAATIVLVPTGTTRDDLDSVLPWMKELLEAKVRASFVLNRVNRRTTSFAKSRARLIRVGPVCPIDIPALEEIHSQSDNGLTVLDLVKSKGHEPMEGLWMFTQQEVASS
jgi:chromosome partitioning protein